MTNERQAVFDKAIAGKIRDLAVAARSEYGSPEVRQALGLIADQLEAHARKYDPPIEEPTERWSVIFANVSGSRMVESKQLVRTDVGWLDGDGNGWGDFNSFSDVEVLRVGIGETYPRVSGGAVVLGPETVKSSDGAVINHKGENYYPRSDGDGSYNRGRRDSANAVHRDVSALRDSTPLVGERRAYDKALAMVAALLDKS